MIEQVLTMILRDGTSTGIIECSLDDWFGISYKIPRNKLKNAASLKAIKNSGVYILFGEDEDTAEKIAYIGEAENIYSRIEQHNRNKDFWNECIVFMSENNSLNKAHIKYIEHELYNISLSTKRFIIKNDVKPTKSSLGTADEIKAKKFIEKIKIITSMFGYRLFDELVTNEDNSNDDNKFYLKFGGEIIGTSILTDEGTVILKGSKIRNEILSSLSPSLLNYCKRERSSSDIVDGVFINDHLCSSPSMAAVVLLGRNANGRNEWKNKDGKSINDLNR
ncbi:MAG: GIY-YIG nuclease family protein [Bacilli bacterium]|nr:GIY-YIG nuclease family protein [Bacilli bacterium]